MDKSQLYLEFELLMTQGLVELLDNKRLLHQLRGLERRTRSGGRDRVDHAKGSHDDLSNVVAGVSVMAGQYEQPEVIVLG